MRIRYILKVSQLSFSIVLEYNVSLIYFATYIDMNLIDQSRRTVTQSTTTALIEIDRQHQQQQASNFMNIGLIKCANCKEALDSSQQIINAKGETFHPHCFVYINLYYIILY